MPQLDLDAIEAQIARLQKLKEIASDPMMLRMIDDFRNDKPFPKPTENAVQSVSHPDSTEAPDVLPMVPRGLLKKEVHDLALANAGWFSGYNLTDQLRQKGFPLVARNPTISVMDILRKMVRDGLLTMREGEGNTPNLFRVRQAESEPQAKE